MTNAFPEKKKKIFLTAFPLLLQTFHHYFYFICFCIHFVIFFFSFAIKAVDQVIYSIDQYILHKIPLELFLKLQKIKQKLKD